MFLGTRVEVPYDNVYKGICIYTHTHTYTPIYIYVYIYTLYMSIYIGLTLYIRAVQARAWRCPTTTFTTAGRTGPTS